MSRKLPPEARDKLVGKLRENLSRRRPRRWLWAVIGIPLVLAAMVGLWFASRTPERLPPLMLVAFDQIDDGSPLGASLIAPGQPDAMLAGMEILWRMDRDGQRIEAMSRTDTAGVARLDRASLPAGPKVGDQEVLVSFIEPAGAYRRDVVAVLAGMPTAVRLVAVDDLVDENDSVDWIAGGIGAATMPRRLPVESSVATVYCSGDVDPRAYLAMRSWLHRHRSDNLPAGPLLRANADDVERRLRDKGVIVTHSKP